MNLSKARGNARHRAPVNTEKLWRRCFEAVGRVRRKHRCGTATTRLVAWIASSVLALLALGGVFWYFVFPDPAPWLAEARRQVEALATPSLMNPSPVGNAPSSLPGAARLLERYLARSGSETDSARLLLAACVAEREPGRAHQYLRSVNLAACATPDLNHAALLFFRAGQQEVVGQLIDAALQTTDHRTHTLQTAALIRFDQGLAEDVLKYCLEWSRLAPRDAQPWRLMCFVYEDQGEAAMLAEAYRNWLERVPAEPDVRRKLVDKLVQLGDAAGARREFQLLSVADSQVTPAVWLTEARLLHLEGQVDPALEKLHAVLQAEPTNAGALLLQGKVQLSRAQFVDAIASLQGVFKQDPTSLEARYLLGQAYARMGDAPRAKEQLALHEKLRSTRVLINGLEVEAARHPQDMQVRQKLVELYRSLGMTEQAQFWKATVNNPAQ